MKATGIVRRIDDLGRVVIPKEIRRTMRIREGDPLEIFTTRDGEVIFKKYSLIGGLEDFAAQFCDTLAHSSDFTAAITDRDSVIATAGPGKRELIGHNLSREMEQLMEGRSVYQRTKEDDALPVCEGSPHLIAATAATSLCQGDVLGLVLFAAGEGELPGESEYKLAQIVAASLGRHMEAGGKTAERRSKRPSAVFLRLPRSFTACYAHFWCRRCNNTPCLRAAPTPSKSAALL